ncbi:chloride channel protein [bacterium]|nr:chloride channel protein [bacterium]
MPNFPSRLHRLTRHPRLAFLRPILDRVRLSYQGGLMFAAIVIGLAGGGGAVIFRKLIKAIEHFVLLVAGGATSHHLANHEILHNIGEFPLALKIAVLVIGSLLSGSIVYRFAREAKGHGVPDVMEAVARKGGAIRKRVAAVKTIASAISIGSGQSLGSEGPIAQIGAAIGSGLGQFQKRGPEQTRLLVACGAAAGIAATFNAPIAGMFFAMEIVLVDFAVGSMAALAVSSVVATIVSRAVLGDNPAFTIQRDFVLASPLEIPAYVLLGLTAGFVAVGFSRLLYVFEDTFDALKKIPEPLRPAIGAVGVAFIGHGFPQVFGVGYEVIDAIFLGEYALGFLAVLVAAKVLATCVSVGAGNSGGVFAPSLVIGSALGGAFGFLAQGFFSFDLEPAAYAVVGMAAVVSATTHAPLTALLIVFEMTDGYAIILPLMLTCAVSTVVARILSRDSIYTLKLSRKGIMLTGGREESILRSLEARSVMSRDIPTVPRATPFRRLVEIMLGGSRSHVYVTDEDGSLTGTMNLYTIKDILQEQGLGTLIIADDVMSRDPPRHAPDDTLADCLETMAGHELDELPIVDHNNRLVGTLSRADVIAAYHKEVVRQSLLGHRHIRAAFADDASTQLALEPGLDMREIAIRGELVGTTLRDLNLRAQYGINCVAVRHPGDDGRSHRSLPHADAPLAENDVLICVGRPEQFRKMQQDLVGKL